MKIYAVEEGSGRRHLVRIECDEPGCSAVLRPGEEVVKFGWVKRGCDNGPGSDKYENQYCPEHA